MPDFTMEQLQTELKSVREKIKGDTSVALKSESDAANEVVAALTERLGKVDEDIKAIEENIAKSAALHIPGLEEEVKTKPFDYGLFIGAALKQAKNVGGAWSDAGHEKEILDQYAKLIGPTMNKKDMMAGDGTQGGYLISPEASGGLVDQVIAKTPLLQMDTTNFPNLVGDMPIQRQTSRNTGFWVGETEAPTESSMAFDEFTLRPRKVGALTRYSNRLDYQTRGAIDGFIRNSISDALGLTIHDGYLQGTGTNSQPKGILTQTGYTVTPNHATSAVRFRLDKAASMIQAIDVANELLDGGSYGFIMRPEVQGGMRRERIPQFTGQAIGQGQPLAGPESLLMSNEELEKRIGYMMRTTTQLSAAQTRGTSTTSSTVIFGNWKQFYTAQWRGLEIKVSNVATVGGVDAMTRDLVWVVAFMEVDSNVGRITAFTRVLDAETNEANWTNG